MKNANAETCARLVATHDWRADWERNEDPIEFLVKFLDHALKIIGVASEDESLRPGQRCAAGYAFTNAIRLAAHLSEKSLTKQHEAFPDIGLQEAVSEAVATLHRVATRSPNTFKHLPHFSRWPILIAADGSPISPCVMPEDLGQGVLGKEATGFSLATGKSRPPALGTKWNRIALRMRELTANHATPLRPPSKTTKEPWPEWVAVEIELERYKADVLERPDIKRWASGTRLSKLKPGAVWAELKKEVQRALLTLADHNAL